MIFVARRRRVKHVNALSNKCTSQTPRLVPTARLGCVEHGSLKVHSLLCITNWACLA